MDHIDPVELKSVLPMALAIEALRTTFESDVLATTPERWHLDLGDGDMLLMPSWDGSFAGVKLVTVGRGERPAGVPSIQGVYVLFDRRDLTPLLSIDGAAITALRTAAVSGLATSYLARPESRRAVIIGAGVQARWHIESMSEVLALEDIAVMSRTRESVAALVRSFDRTEVRPGDLSDLAEADVVCTCTTSREPVLARDQITPGVHINAVGAYKPDAREIDPATVAESRLVVETRSAALAEAGDILLAVEEGAISRGHVVADLSEVVRGTEVRRSPEDITLFKSVGAAFEDLAIATEVARRVL